MAKARWAEGCKTSCQGDPLDVRLRHSGGYVSLLRRLHIYRSMKTFDRYCHRIDCNTQQVRIYIHNSYVRTSVCKSLYFHLCSMHVGSSRSGHPSPTSLTPGNRSKSHTMRYIHTYCQIRDFPSDHPSVHSHIWTNHPKFNRLSTSQGSIPQINAIHTYIHT